MDVGQLKELIRIFEASDLYEIEVEENGRRVRLRKGPQDGPAALPSPNAPLRPQLEEHLAQERPPIIVPATRIEPEPPPPSEEDLPAITAPMVGVFYASPAPGRPAFVSPGDTVDEHQTVCIIEAMKLMNEVTAKFRAEIVSVLVENGEPVEYGQPLFTIRPLGRP